MKPRILIADDDPQNLELLWELLSGLEADVSGVMDGLAALERFAQERPDLVVLDVQMPGLDGIETCRRIKQCDETRLTPVILVTGLTAVEDRIRGIEAGADDFLAKPFDRSELTARVRSLLSLKLFTDELERAESVLFALARSIEGKDPYTLGHCERLSAYSVALGRRLGLSAKEIEALQRAGIVHDIGKVAVPDSILLKPARLTREEREVMQQHPLVGEDICAPLRSFQLVLPIIRHHHERADGSGYPDGLGGEQVPLTARVLQVVDVYDALTTARPYKPALAPREALDTLEAETRCGWWDGAIVSQFRGLVERGELPRQAVPPQAVPSNGGKPSPTATRRAAG